MRHLNLRAPLLAITFLVLCVRALTQPLSIGVQVLPPYSAQYADYFGNMGNVVVTITNSTQQDRSVYLAGSIHTLDGSVSVSVNGDQPWSGPPLIVHPGSNAYTGSALSSYSTLSSSVQRVGISEEQIALGLLPEGEYQVCMRAFDYDAPPTPLSAEEPSGCSNVINITYPAPPMIISPSCGGSVTALTPASILFQWQLPSGNPIGALINYRFKMVRMGVATDAADALNNSGDLVYQGDVINSVLLWNNLFPVLEEGTMYAWWVQAVDMNNEVVFQNNGFSEPCTFTFGDEDAGSSSTFALAYPADGDTLPWDFMPVIARFDPYASYTYFHSTLDIQGSSLSEAYTQTRLLRWASGPQPSQQSLMHNSGVPALASYALSQDESRHINIYKSNAEAGAEKFTHGHGYAVDGRIDLSRNYEGTNPVSGAVHGHFASGMGRPVPLSPANGAVIPKNGGDPAVPGSATVPLLFKTSNAPSHLLPPYPIWYQGEDDLWVQIDGRMSERWVLNVSQDPTLANPVYTASDLLGSDAHLLGGDCNEDCLRADLYKEITRSFTPPDTGTYYWQVRWLNDPGDILGASYRDGPVRKFRVVGTAPVVTDVVRAPECLADCRSEPVPLIDRVAVDTVHVGDVVHVGKFSMHVELISFSGTSATGDGIMDVPFMKAPLRVHFANIGICSVAHALTMFQGVVKGSYDNTGVVPPGWVNGGSLFVGFTPQVAQQLDDFLNTTGRVVSQFTSNNPMGLPVGIDTDLPEGRLIIGIVGASFTDTMATLNAAMGLPMPDFGTTIGLGNMNIPFHPGGVGSLDKEGTLYLLGDVNKSIAGDTLRLNGTRFTPDFQQVLDSGTFVSWDCKGFRALQVEGQYRFSKDHVLEDLPNGDDGPDKVIGSFRVRTGRAGFVARIDFNKPWHMKGARGWGIDVQEAWIDHADFMNPPDIAYPGTPEMLAAIHEDDGIRNPLWQGIWVKQAMLRLPSGIKAFNNTERITALVNNLIHDDHGFSGSLRVANLIGPDLGDLHGWGFSMDTLQLDIIANSFAQAGFSGRIHLPITDTLLVYSAMVQQNIDSHYWQAQFLLHPKNTINANVYVGTLQLDPTSHLEAVIGDTAGSTHATVVLNGKLSIDHTFPKIGHLNFHDIGFEKLTFSTEAPYTNVLDDETWSFTSPQKFIGGTEEDDTDPTSGDATPRQAGGFPISLTRVQADRRTIDGHPAAGLLFDLNLNLSGTTNIFVATTRIAVLGTLNTTGMHKWGDHGLELDSIGVTGETGAVKIVGGLRWYNGDATYGDGIKGLVNAWFLKGKLQVQASAQFGSVHGYNYWYADAMIAKSGGFSPGSAFNVFGFGGAAWYHMKPPAALPSAQQVTEKEIAQQDDPNAVPGLTLTGMVMKPDPATAFGFLATVVFGDGATGTAYNGDLSAGMTFSTSGGVDSVFLNGNVYLLQKRDDRTYAPIHGTAHISFDFPNDVFSANFKMFVQVGHGMVVGSAGANGLAGNADILITPDTWHFFVGEPQTPIGLQFLGFIKGNFYFMVGKDLPPPIPPPEEVASIVPSDFWTRPDFSNADGLAFGARVSISDTAKFLLFKLYMSAEIGFDIAFHPTDHMDCADITDPGIGGWYASGQLYGYVAGGVSLYVDVGFYDGEYHLFDVTAAAVMRGGFANPSYARGAVHGSYSILHGWVSGSVTFPFQLGSPCVTPPGGLLSGLDPIGDLTPHDQAGIASGSPGVDCGVEPEAVFNMDVGPAFTMTATLADGSREEHTFRLVLDKFELRNKTTNTLLACNMNTAPDHQQAQLWPQAYLKPNTLHTVYVKVKAEEFVNGVWVPGLNKEHVQATWERLNTFRTGNGIDELRAEDIDYSYPFVNQRYLLQDECRKGIIQCKADMSGQPVFSPPAGRKRTFRAVFVPVIAGTNITVDAVVHLQGQTSIDFPIPSLANERAYTLKLVARDAIDVSTMQMAQAAPPGGSSSPQGGIQAPGIQDAMMSTAVASTSTSLASDMLHVLHRTLSGYTLRADEKLVYGYSFRTSRYNTVPAKAAGFQNTSTSINADENDPLIGQTLIPSFSGEPFDVFDIKGYAYTSHSCSTCRIQPLIGMYDAHVDSWYKTYAKPVLYDYYAQVKASHCSALQLSRTVLTRTIVPGMHVTTILDHPDSIGIPPTNTVTLSPGTPPAPVLTAAEAVPSNGFSAMNMPTSMTTGSASSAPSAPGPDMTLFVATSSYVFNDQYRLRTITQDAINNCGPPNAAELPMNEPMRTYVLNFLNTPYRRLYNGNYGVAFFFRPPPPCTPFLDSGETGAPLSSGNTMFHNPTGGNAPAPTVPPIHSTTVPTMNH